MESRNEVLWDTKEAAAYLKVPLSWVYARTRGRSIPMRKIGRHVRIPKAEFIAWVDTQTDSGPAKD